MAAANQGGGIVGGAGNILAAAMAAAGIPTAPDPQGPGIAAGQGAGGNAPGAGVTGGAGDIVAAALAAVGIPPAPGPGTGTQGNTAGGAPGIAPGPLVLQTQQALVAAGAAPATPAAPVAAGAAPAPAKPGNKRKAGPTTWRGPAGIGARIRALPGVPGAQGAPAPGPAAAPAPIAPAAAGPKAAGPAAPVPPAPGPGIPAAVAPAAGGAAAIGPKSVVLAVAGIAGDAGPPYGLLEARFSRENPTAGQPPFPVFKPDIVEPQPPGPLVAEVTTKEVITTSVHCA